MEVYDYDAAASTVKIEDITSDEINREILRRIEENDPSFVKLSLVGGDHWTNDRGNHRYRPGGARDLGWLGYFIGKNTKLKEIMLWSNPFEGINNKAIEHFCRGVNGNRSIQNICLHQLDLMGGELFSWLRPFFEDNYNMDRIEVRNCTFGTGCARQLSVALKGCNKSLKSIEIDFNGVGGEWLIDILPALGTHSQLEKLQLNNMNLGRNGCTALANLLQLTFTQLHVLDLSDNDIDDEAVNILVGVLNNNINLRNLAIDDEGVDALVDSLPSSRLQSLSLARNRNIMARRCQSLVALLKNPNCNLEKLYLVQCAIRDEGALNLANALSSNCKLKELNLRYNGITTEGWSSFSKVLCDTSSINATFLSNHSLESLGVLCISNIPRDVRSLLRLNKSSENKRRVAIKKILKHHQHFDMQPFFEWDLKVLPIAVTWFERARSIGNNDEAGIDKRKLDAIYQFILAMPMVYVEGWTRRELDEISSSIMELSLKLKDLKDRRVRAMLRL